MMNGPRDPWRERRELLEYLLKARNKLMSGQGQGPDSSQLPAVVAVFFLLLLSYQF